VVGEHLLAAIKEVLGDSATAPIVAARGEAYQALADILINAEADLYDEAAARPGGGEAGATSSFATSARKAT
jgi:nitric oxide dioxygenase